MIQTIPGAVNKLADQAQHGYGVFIEIKMHFWHVKSRIDRNLPANYSAQNSRA